MKLLVISAAFPPLRVGEAEHAFHLCRHLANRGLDVHVLTTKTASPIRGLPFRVYPVMKHWQWWGLRDLAIFIRHCGPDAVLLIHTDRDYEYHPMIMFAPALSKRLLPRAPFVTQLETRFLSRRVSIATQASLKIGARLLGPKRLDYAFGTLLCKSDRVIVLSEEHRQILSAVCPKTLVIPPPPLLRVTSEDNGKSRERGRTMLGAKPEDILIAYYGYLYPDKGIETLFKAFQAINKENTNSRLVMIGASLSFQHSSSYLKRLYELGRSLGIDDQIMWTGEYASDSEDASLYFRASDICVLPFDHGVTLNRSSLAAAAAHGLPIVTTAAPQPEAAFTNEENMLLCPPRDPESIALAVTRLIKNPELRKRLSNGVLELARKFFSWDQAIARTIEAVSP